MRGNRHATETWGVPIRLNSIEEVLYQLNWFRLHRPGWLFRGQTQCYKNLLPSIDRPPYFSKVKDRRQKLELEQVSIELFRHANKETKEEYQKIALTQNITTLMLLQHLGAPTRLLDWTFSPYVAVFFSVCDNDDCDSEIWSFDYTYYTVIGPKQWETFSDTLDKEGKFDNSLEVAFKDDYSKNWFVCQFYFKYFPRYSAQNGAFTFTPQFNQDHSIVIKKFFDNDPAHYQKYIIAKQCKGSIRAYLREKLLMWRGSIYPDSVGTAQGVLELLRDEAHKCVEKNAPKNRLSHKYKVTRKKIKHNSSRRHNKEGKLR
jgi:hypothetical protein